MSPAEEVGDDPPGQELGQLGLGRGREHGAPRAHGQQRREVPAARVGVEGLQHGVEAQPVGRGVVVGIARQPQAGTAEQRRMIPPRGVAHVHHRSGRGGRQQFGPDAQRAAAARHLDRAQTRQPNRAAGRAQHQFGDRVIEFAAASRRDIGLGGLAREHGALGAAHAFEHRRVAAEIAEHPDPEIDLVGRWIGAKLRHQGEDRVRLQTLEPFEQLTSPIVGAESKRIAATHKNAYAARPHGSSRVCERPTTR